MPHVLITQSTINNYYAHDLGMQLVIVHHEAPDEYCKVIIICKYLHFLTSECNQGSSVSGFVVDLNNRENYIVCTVACVCVCVCVRWRDCK